MAAAGSGSALIAGASSLVARGWTQGADARNADGEPVEPWSAAAVRWSLLGALVAVLEELTPEGARPDVVELAAACVRLADVIEEPSLERWNDDPLRDRVEVLAVLASALDRAFDVPGGDGATDGSSG